MTQSRMTTDSSVPIRQTLILATTGVIGGLAVGYVGVIVASGLLGPSRVADPWNLFGNALEAMFALMVVAVGALTGFLAGTMVAPLATMRALKWHLVGRTFGYHLALSAVTTPSTLFALVLIGNAVETRRGVQGLTIVAAVIIGGVVPGLARWLALHRE